MEWGEVVRTIRDAVARSSQHAVAEAIGVGESAVSRWLAGTREATGSSRAKVYAWAERQRQPSRSDLPPMLQGRSVEVEALLEYALERQRRLTAAISDAVTLPTPARRRG